MSQRTLKMSGSQRSLARKYLLADVGVPPTSGIIRDATLVSEYSFVEGIGPVVYNRVYPVPASPNLLPMPEQAFSLSGFAGGALWTQVGTPTIADLYAASPAGDTTASRCKFTVSVASSLLQSMQLTAQAYTLSVWVATNVSSSAQTFRLRIGASVISSTQTTGTVLGAFTLFSVTGTASAGTNTVGITSDASNDACDMQIWGIRLETGSTATPYQRPIGELYLGRGSTAATAPTWNARGLPFASTSDQFCMGMFAAAPSFTRSSFYVVFKRLANINPVSGFNYLWGCYNSGTIFNIATANGNSISQNQWSGGGVVNQLDFTLNAQNFASGMCDPFDGNWHCLTCVYDPSAVYNNGGGSVTGCGITYFDGLEIARTAIGAATVGTWTNQFWNLCTNGGVRYGDNEINYSLNYSATHMPAQVLQNTQALRNILIGRGVNPSQAIPDPTTVNLLIWEGDSITNAQGFAGWPAVTQASLSPCPIARNVAITGSFADTDTPPGATATVGSGAFRRSNYVHTLFNSRRRRNIVHLLFGANDLNSASSNLAGYVQCYKELVQSYCAMGWKVLICSVMPAARGGIGGTWGTNTTDDLRDYATSPAIYTASANYLLRNWTLPIGATFADIGYGYIDACSVSAFFTAKWAATAQAVGPGYAVTVNLSGGAVVTGTSGITIANGGNTFIELPTCWIFGGNGTGATATVTAMACATAVKSAGGSGYAVNDTITLAPRGSDTFATAPILKVLTVSSGAVLTASIQTAGSATALAGTTAAFSQASTSGVGTGATFTLTWGLLTINVTAGGSGYTNSGLQPVANYAGPFPNATYVGSASEWDSTYSNDGTHPNAGGCAFFASTYMVPKLQRML